MYQNVDELRNDFIKQVNQMVKNVCLVLWTIELSLMGVAYFLYHYGRVSQTVGLSVYIFHLMVGLYLTGIIKYKKEQTIQDFEERIALKLKKNRRSKQNYKNGKRIR